MAMAASTRNLMVFINTTQILNTYLPSGGIVMPKKRGSSHYLAVAGLLEGQIRVAHTPSSRPFFNLLVTSM